MSHNNSHKALCRQVERKLSPFIDGELEELERLGLERHLESCAACRQELELLTEASGLLREEGRSVPAPPPWEAVRRTLAASGKPRSIWKRWLGFDRAIAASIGLLALAGLLFAVVRGEWPPGTERTAGRVDERRVQLAGLPGLKGFLADHRAQEVDAADLDERLDFSPHVAEELPGGFRLHTAYVVHDRCSAGSCLIYRRGDELVTLLQHPPSHPVSWRSGNLVDCTVAGLACRKARGPGIEILQIDPEGRNLTLVARVGAIDSALFVRALSRR